MGMQMERDDTHTAIVTQNKQPLLTRVFISAYNRRRVIYQRSRVRMHGMIRLCEVPG